MRPNRKADLQRKLTLAAIPTPPAGLAERIKTDIPKHLPDSTAERQRLGSAVAFNMRVAASILLLVGSLFVALNMLNHAYRNEDQHLKDFSRSLENNKAPSTAASPVPKLPQSASNVVTSTEEPPATVVPPEPRRRVAENEVADARAEAKPDAKAKPGDRQFAYSGSGREKDEAANSPAQERADLDKQRDDSGRAAFAAPSATPKPSPAPTYAQAEETGKVAPAQPSAASSGWNVDGVNLTSTTAPAPQKPASDSLARKSAAQAAAQSAPVSGLAAAPPQFKKLSHESITSLVQQFSAPAERPRRGVRLEADAAPSPVDSTKGVLRISIDAAAYSAGADRSATAVATGAHLEIEINGRAVTSHRAMTGEPSTGEGTLEKGTSSTAVYEFQLSPSVSARTVLATVRLRFRSTSDGREQTLERTVSVRDIAASWDAASLRTKRASLAAAYVDTRTRGADTSAIAEKARAIGLDELADLATPR